jgi:hypothetical protein
MLLATSDARLRLALGKDADTLFAMREAAEPGAMWLVEKVGGRIEDIKSVAQRARIAALAQRIRMSRPALALSPELVDASK